MSTKAFWMTFLAVFLALMAAGVVYGLISYAAASKYGEAVDDSHYRTCRANMMTIANAEMAFRVRTREAFTPDLTQLVDLPGGIPLCPESGQYSVSVGRPSNSFTVHCSVIPHDASAADSPRVIRRD